MSRIFRGTPVAWLIDKHDADQSIASQTAYVQVAFSRNREEAGDCVDLDNNEIIAKVPGLYLIRSSVNWAASLTDQTLIEILIKQNNSYHGEYQRRASGASSQSVMIEHLLTCSVGDRLGIWAYNGHVAAQSVRGKGYLTWFCGFLLART